MGRFNKIGRNPFQPEDIVDSKKFVGREVEIEKGKNLIDQVIGGRISAIRIIGDPGMGKTSLATYLYSLYENTRMNPDSDVIDIDHLHVDISPANNFEEFLFLIQYQLASDIREKGLWEMYKGLFAGFGRYFLDVVTRQQTININVKLSEEAKRNSPAVNPQALKNNLRDYCKARIEEGKSAFILTLDNINGLVEDERFPRFLKGMREEFGRAEKELPFCLILCAITERWESIEVKHRPVTRIFTEQFDLEPLKDRHVEKFFLDRFNNHDISLDDDVLSLLVGFTEGIPMNMQRIGYEIFGYVEDGRVSEAIAVQGIISAAKKLSGSPIMAGECTDPLSKRFDNVLLSEQRLRVAESDLWEEEEVSRAELLTNFSESEINNFIKYLTDNCILKPRSKTRSGRYEFANKMMQYLFLKRVREESQKKRKEAQASVKKLLDFVE